MISAESLKTIGQGALGAMTFGIYHQIVTNKMMELNNEKMELKQKFYIDNHNREIIEFKDKINKIENKIIKIETGVSRKITQQFFQN